VSGLILCTLSLLGGSIALGGAALEEHRAIRGHVRA
jgi:hypothetical protein